mmetsp:Transcript_64052/g.143138  ORF Transcript_64052/g.143138 Transcript_64052/m.143138 type:complete len:84 (-) Transcript_64052:376-627(-)
MNFRVEAATMVVALCPVVFAAPCGACLPYLEGRGMFVEGSGTGRVCDCGFTFPCFSLFLRLPRCFPVSNDAADGRRPSATDGV